MNKSRNGNRRARLAGAGAKHDRGRSNATPAPGRKPVSEADVMAPWARFGRQLAAESARRLRGHAPNFLVIAPPKTATTWVHEILSTDRRFFMPEKECRYFSHFWREYPLSSYYAQFQNPFGAVWRGEASPSYFILPPFAIRAIHDELPDTKLIVLLRDPGERLWSHVRHTFMHKEGWFRSSTSWRIEEVSETEWRHALLHPVIRAFDDYAGPLARWAEHFPAEQILLLTSEMIGAEPERAAQEIYDFLALEKPATESPFLRNRPNPSPWVSLPGSIAELLAAFGATNRSRLEAALGGLPLQLAEQIRAAISHWQDADRYVDVTEPFVKPVGMPRGPHWDRLTITTFPRDLLSWSYRSIGAPANAELLHLAALNFEYAYFSEQPEDAAAKDPLLRRVQALGTGMIQHATRLSGIERTAEGLGDRLSGLERVVEQRTGRLLQEAIESAVERNLEEYSVRTRAIEAGAATRDARLTDLEQTIEERSGRLNAVERGSEEFSARIAAIEIGSATRDGQLADLEQTIEERSGRLNAVERGSEEFSARIAAIEFRSATRDARLAGLEQTIEERNVRLAAIERGNEECRDQVGSIEASGTKRDQRLAALEGTIEERTARILGIENRLTRHEQRTADIETTSRAGEDRLGGLERYIEERATRLANVEHKLETLHQRTALEQVDLQKAVASHSDRLTTLESTAATAEAKFLSITEFATRLHEHAERIGAIEHGGAERNTESAEQKRDLHELRSALAATVADIAMLHEDRRELETLGGQLLALHTTIEKALYAIALLQESMQGMENDLCQVRLSRIETELPPLSASERSGRIPSA